ncbi:MAG TPA: hypothetical protein VEI50_04625 [Nitrospiraceae bacterium]|nr:hypothetical protein [Nitrospiraceae bacterium]
MSKWSHQLLLNLVIVIGSLFFGIAMVELSMYLAGLDYALVWQPDQRVGWRHVPGARKLWTEEGRGWVEINKLGYRDHERTLEKHPGTFRIAVFGDSMTEAFQVNLDQTFTHLLEESLGKSGHRVEVLNFGVSGYSPIQELLLFKQEGPRYHPDLVILAVFLDNDIRDSHPQLSASRSGPPFLAMNGEAVEFDFARTNQSVEDYQRQPFFWLRSHSGIYRLVSTWLWRRGEQARSEAVPRNTAPERYQVYQKAIQAKWEQAWSFSQRALLEFAEEAKRQQTQFVLLSVPSPYVVNGGAWQSVIATYPSMMGADWDPEGPENRLRVFTREQHIPLIQPYKEFQEASKGPPIFWNNVGHFTPYGHQLMAKVLHDVLTGSRLLPDHNKESYAASVFPEIK